MAQPRGTVPVMLAVGGNFSVALLKLGGYFLSGSSSLFSEAIHSFADTANQALLLVGIRLSGRKPTEDFAYGYGNERFLWALISACGIFFVGAGVTVWHGVMALQDPSVAHIDLMTFAILLVSLVIESYTFKVALDELRAHNPEATLAEALRDGDPSTTAVVYEDGVAVAGIAIAFIGIFLTFLTGNGIWDALGSIAVGACLAVVAVILINKNRLYLIGKSIPEPEREEIIAMLDAEPCIEKVIDFKSTILDVGKYHVKCEVEWNGAALADKIIGENLEDDFNDIAGDYDEFKRYIAYTTNRIPRIIGRKIDEIEKKIIAEFPEVAHIDIEIN